MNYFTCPLCGDSDFDKIGMALHFENCEPAAELRSEYCKNLRKWEAEHIKKFPNRQEKRPEGRSPAAPMQSPFNRD